mmetsp:Transcript_27512/g.79744  ORF Transcript_27512/g.79744 Transcript_27512/m.79744 type:complete len:221 (-) Transcript_27512:617-1279(-)
MVVVAAVVAVRVKRVLLDLSELRRILVDLALVVALLLLLHVLLVLVVPLGLLVDTTDAGGSMMVDFVGHAGQLLAWPWARDAVVARRLRGSERAVEVEVHDTVVAAWAPEPAGEAIEILDVVILQRETEAALAEPRDANPNVLCSPRQLAHLVLLRITRLAPPSNLDRIVRLRLEVIAEVDDEAAARKVFRDPSNVVAVPAALLESPDCVVDHALRRRLQ